MKEDSGELVRVNVAVGVITKDQLFFVCRRKAHQHQGNKWEFPGGKVEPGEAIEVALSRELKEEIGIDVMSTAALMSIDFTYPEKQVSLHIYLVKQFSGTAHGAEGQEAQWVDFKNLQSLDFPDANLAILDKLKSLGYH